MEVTTFSLRRVYYTRGSEQLDRKHRNVCASHAVTNFINTRRYIWF